MEFTDKESRAWRKYVNEYFARNGISEYIKHTYYYGGRNSEFTKHQGFDVCKVIPKDLASSASNAIAKCILIYNEIDSNYLNNKWWCGEFSAQEGLRLFSGATLYQYGCSPQIHIGKDLIITLMKNGTIFIQGHNQNVIDDFKKWLVIFHLKISK